jgi:hypothetical protein
MRGKDIEVTLVSSEMPPIGPCIDDDALRVKSGHTDEDWVPAAFLDSAAGHSPCLSDPSVIRSGEGNVVGAVCVIVSVVECLERRRFVRSLLEFMLAGEFVVDNTELCARIEASRNGGASYTNRCSDLREGLYERLESRGYRGYSDSL